jgi:Ca2+-binding RTX toxin-like protein
VRRIGSIALSLTLAGAALLVTAGPALASTVGISGSVLVFTASPGEANNAEVEGGGGLPFSIEDLGAPLSPGPGCTSAGVHRVTCPSTGVTSLSFDGGDLNDILINNTGLTSTFKGGCGNDVIEGGHVSDTLAGDPPSGCAQAGNDSLDGRDGSDVILGGSGIDILKGSAGRDRITGGPSEDQIDGGSGADRIASDDGETDTVTCGAGFDSVRPDATDSVASDCELVVA